VSIITLGVKDLKRSAAFYEGLGFVRSAKSDDEIVWFNTGGTVLGLYPWNAMAEDSGVPPEGSGFRGVTLAINLRNEREVDDFVDRAKRLGARIIRPPKRCSGEVTRPSSMTSTGTSGRLPTIRSLRSMPMVR
jgi:hypothetical protein